MATKKQTTKTSYQQQLDDPRWQKKRLEILERESFACQECKAKDKKLNVHHNYYDKGKMAWEYNETCYDVLCDDCHEKRHKALKYVEIALCGKGTQYIEKVACIIELSNEEDLYGLGCIAGKCAEIIPLVLQMIEFVGKARSESYGYGKNTWVRNIVMALKKRGIRLELREDKIAVFGELTETEKEILKPMIDDIIMFLKEEMEGL